MSQAGNGDRASDRIFDSNRLHYEVRVDPAARQWWRDRFMARFGFTPEDVGDAL